MCGTRFSRSRTYKNKFIVKRNTNWHRDDLNLNFPLFRVKLIGLLKTIKKPETSSYSCINQLQYSITLCRKNYVMLQVEHEL